MTEKFADLSQGQQIEILGSEYYGMVFLGLANAAYTDAGGRSSQEISNELQKAIKSTNCIPLLPELGQEGVREPKEVVPGHWSFDWGPAFPSTELARRSNLIYIASYRDPQDKPYFFVVGIRGTDISAGGESVVKQVFQDFDAFAMTEWSHLFATERSKLDTSTKTGPAPGGRVAQGSYVGAENLINGAPLPPKDEIQPPGTLREALPALLKETNAVGTPIVVTGHSLGGCQTQTIATYLQWLCPENTVIPHAFAPSTAGDLEFISNPVFNRGGFWFNTLDLVPWGFVTIMSGTEAEFPDAIVEPKPVNHEETHMPGAPKLGAEWAAGHLWTGFRWPENTDGLEFGPDLPLLDVIKLAIDGKGLKLINNGYARPRNGSNNILKKMNGTIPDPDTIAAFYKKMHPHKKQVTQKEWSNSITQLEWQHFPPNYRIIMWENYQKSMVYYKYSSYS